MDFAHRTDDLDGELARDDAPSYHVIYRAVVDPAMGIKDNGHRDIDPDYRLLVDEAVTTVHTRLGAAFSASDVPGGTRTAVRLPFWFPRVHRAKRTGGT
ncbi:MAG: hypothetical protein GEV28_25675 [Actinophytocola sp.]|uniref:hypothetical protein n=1 Tax=Actinophytocola sp. TaxID=1872138 RepID=UPI0013231559|nr:hypothetical protein [Actinophytocola sp.]MPZ83596.1 hypothetical protein [Actinophytocola sp.]